VLLLASTPLQTELRRPA